MGFDLQKYTVGAISAVVAIVVIVVLIPVIFSVTIPDTVPNYAALTSMIGITPLLIIVGVILGIVAMFLFNRGKN